MESSHQAADDLSDHEDSQQRPSAVQKAAKVAQNFRRTVWIVAGVTYLAMIVPAWMDRSWTALGIAIGLSPTVHAGIMFLQIIGAVVITHVHPSIEKQSLMPFAIGVPIFSAAATTATIFMMDLHGC